MNESGGDWDRGIKSKGWGKGSIENCWQLARVGRREFTEHPLL